jgi:hypothetical protein
MSHRVTAVACLQSLGRADQEHYGQARARARLRRDASMPRPHDSTLNAHVKTNHMVCHSRHPSDLPVGQYIYIFNIYIIFIIYID